MRALFIRSAWISFITFQTVHQKYFLCFWLLSKARKPGRCILIHSNIISLIHRIHLLCSSSLSPSLFFIYLYQRKLIKRKLENQEILDLLQQQEMKTTYALLEGQDKERKRIASELHDNLGSILVTLNMYADSLTSKSKPEQVLDIANRISDTSKKANEEVRKISHSLDSGLLKHFGLKTAITQLMEAIELSKKIKVQLNIQLEEDLSNELGLQVYRMIQELVNNSLKHSNCAKINLDIQVNGEITIIYEDNGVGFDLKKVERGMGLNNIQQRVEKLSGELKIDSLPNRGSTFIIELPTT